MYLYSSDNDLFGCGRPLSPTLGVQIFESLENVTADPRLCYCGHAIDANHGDRQVWAAYLCDCRVLLAYTRSRNGSLVQRSCAAGAFVRSAGTRMARLWIHPQQYEGCSRPLPPSKTRGGGQSTDQRGNMPCESMGLFGSPVQYTLRSHRQILNVLIDGFRQHTYLLLLLLFAWILSFVVPT